jgi:hypothetical protein
VSSLSGKRWTSLFPSRETHSSGLSPVFPLIVQLFILVAHHVGSVSYLGCIDEKSLLTLSVSFVFYSLA